MSNSFLENPKVALGFAGVVVAIALVASVALEEFTPGEDETIEDASLQQAQAPAQVSQQAAPAPAAATGWAGDAGVSDDWGAPSTAMQNGGFAGVPEQTNDAPVVGDHVARSVSNGAQDRSGGPSITSRAAPGAPEVRGPRSGQQGEITIAGN